MNLQNRLHNLRRLIREEIEILSEDYARGIPDFVLVQISRDAAETMRQYLVRHINQTTVNPEDRRQKSAAANITLQELEIQMKELMEDKLSQYLRSV